MASAFGHAFMAYAIGKTYSPLRTTLKFVVLGMLCAVAPDADVITFQFGIKYDDFLGHRGFFHSLFFAFFFSLFITFLFYRDAFKDRQWMVYVLYFFLCTSSHALLDMLTSGGRGVAIFAPFNIARYFFPWRPIRVSPIGVGKFFSEWGLRVIKSELLIIGLPCSVYILLVSLVRNLKRKNPGEAE